MIQYDNQKPFYYRLPFFIKLDLIKVGQIKGERNFTYLYKLTIKGIILVFKNEASIKRELKNPIPNNMFFNLIFL